MIKVGDKIPQTTLKVLTASGIEDVNLNDHLKGKKVVLVGFPGAFTSICTNEHLSSFLPIVDKFKAKGVDEIIAIAVNDVCVLDALANHLKSAGKITFLSDWDASFVKKVGLSVDASFITLGLRSLRYNAIVEDEVLRYIDIEESIGVCSLTKADEILKHL